MKPTIIPGGPVSFIPDTLSKNAAVKARRSGNNIPLRSSSSDYINNDDDSQNNNDEDEHADDDDDDEEYEEEEPKKTHHRRTRQASNGFEDNHLCSSTECAKIQCYIKHLSRDEEVSVTFSSVVWVKTLQKVGNNGTNNFVAQDSPESTSFYLDFPYCIFRLPYLDQF